MNIVEEILLNSAKKSEIKVGEIIEVIPDLVMNHDGDNIYNIKAFKNLFEAKEIEIPNKVVMGLDHNVPPDSSETARIHSEIRNFAQEQGVEFYDHEGVMHQLMIENHIKPYQLVFAADSHACSYGGLGALGLPIGTTDNAYIWATGSTWVKVPQVTQIRIKGNPSLGVYAKDIVLKIIGELKCDGLIEQVVQLCGKGTYSLSLSGKITLCNMIAEAGAYSSIIDPREPCISEPDIYFDISSLEPQIAAPHNVDNVCDVEEKAGVKVNQVFIGSCTNGRFKDFEIACQILAGKQVKKGVRLFITPASKRQLEKIMEKGYLKPLLEAGATLLNPGCSLCFGSSQGIMDDGEVLLTTGNRNYKGRVGTDKSLIYIGSPATAAATALTGKITDPRPFL